MHTIKRLALALAVTTCGFAGLGATAQASDCYSKPPVYKTVVLYETVEVAHVTYVTKYKPCGTPYRVKVVQYRTVRVPVEKRVKIGW